MTPINLIASVKIAGNNFEKQFLEWINQYDLCVNKDNKDSRWTVYNIYAPTNDKYSVCDEVGFNGWSVWDIDKIKEEFK